VWEQVSSASCTGYAMALAAHALGYGAVWKSSNFLEGAALRDALGLREAERVLGWVNLGTGPEKAGPEHARPALADVVTELDATTRRPRAYSGPPAPDRLP
jgi:nitroreductase